MINIMKIPMKPKNFMRILRTSGNVIGFAIALSVFSMPAYAEILLGVTRTSPAIYGGSNYSIDWNGAAAGGTYQYFETTEPNTRVVISFNAECAVMTAGSQKWVGIDIVVNPAGPTG